MPRLAPVIRAMRSCNLQTEIMKVEYRKEPDKRAAHRSHCKNCTYFLRGLWLSAAPSQKVQKFLDGHLRLPENAFQDGGWQIKAVMTGNRHPEVWLQRMPQLNMASGLVIDFEACSLQCA